MKIRTALLLVPVLLALCFGTAVAKPAPTHAGLDPSFGQGGKIAVSVSKGEAGPEIQMATAPSGKSYVLVGSLLLAFGADGHPDTGFARHGRLRVAAAAGETTGVTGLAVDAHGRILVSGSVDPTPGVPSQWDPNHAAQWTYLPPPSRAFVIRYLPDGEQDPTFGVGGQLEITLTPPARTTADESSDHLENPVVQGDRLAVINGDQPVLGGSYSYYFNVCYSGNLRTYSFVAPVGGAGSAVENLPPTGYTELPEYRVSRLLPMPFGNVAAMAFEPPCGSNGEPSPGVLTDLSYGSRPAPTLDPARPQVSLASLAFGPRGQMYTLEREWRIHDNEEFPLPPVLVRLSPDGSLDTRFGTDGGLPLKKFGEEWIGGVVVGPDARAVVACGNERFRLVRVGTKGKIDHSFGKHGWVDVGFGKGSEASPSVLTVDGKGRVLAAGWVKSPSLKGGEGIGLIRVATR